MLTTCPVCDLKDAEVLEPEGYDENLPIDCAACGRFKIPADVAAKYRSDPNAVARLRHGIRSMQKANPNQLVSAQMAARFAAEPLPSVREQHEALISLIGDRLRENDPAGQLTLDERDLHALSAEIGTYEALGARRALLELRKRGLVYGMDSLGWPVHAGLVLEGWDAYEQLRRSPSKERLAFIAMPFDVPLLDRVYTKVFKPAVAATNFRLQRVDDPPKAGLIDDRIRVEIRKARFVIAELTGANLGVYWESGFAEGLGRPVIYTCEKGFFDDPKTRPHFDTNHYTTVVWSESALAEAGELLKLTIRATLPDEAKLTDD